VRTCVLFVDGEGGFMRLTQKKQKQFPDKLCRDSPLTVVMPGIYVLVQILKKTDEKDRRLLNNSMFFSVLCSQSLTSTKARDQV
jgi:hypothetical protein